jgi:16S rRNA (guanine527-N7)-methyltransferase
MKPEEMLCDGASRLGIMLPGKETGLFMRYLEELKVWNRKINLTGLTTERDIIVTHFLDSITASGFVPEGARLLDIGSGAGFPGIPLKIISPSLDVTLLDSSHKKVMFMRELVRSLGLVGINAIWGRAEDENNGIPRRHFDRVITRAVGQIPEILALSAPYLIPEGMIILMRGRRGRVEWKHSEVRLKGMFRLIERREFTLPFGGQSRVIFAVEPA